MNLELVCEFFRDEERCRFWELANNFCFQELRVQVLPDVPVPVVSMVFKHFSCGLDNRKRSLMPALVMDAIPKPAISPVAEVRKRSCVITEQCGGAGPFFNGCGGFFRRLRLWPRLRL